MQEDQEPQKKTLSEAGRLGGKKLAKERGPEYYRAIGRKGGATVKARYGRDYFSNIGMKGGKARVAASREEEARRKEAE